MNSLQFIYLLELFFSYPYILCLEIQILRIFQFGFQNRIFYKIINLKLRLVYSVFIIETFLFCHLYMPFLKIQISCLFLQWLSEKAIIESLSYHKPKFKIVFSDLFITDSFLSFLILTCCPSKHKFCYLFFQCFGKNTVIKFFKEKLRLAFLSLFKP